MSTIYEDLINIPNKSKSIESFIKCLDDINIAYMNRHYDSTKSKFMINLLNNDKLSDEFKLSIDTIGSEPYKYIVDYNTIPKSIRKQVLTKALYELTRGDSSEYNKFNLLARNFTRNDLKEFYWAFNKRLFTVIYEVSDYHHEIIDIEEIMDFLTQNDMDFKKLIYSDVFIESVRNNGYYIKESLKYLYKSMVYKLSNGQNYCIPNTLYSDKYGFFEYKANFIKTYINKDRINNLNLMNSLDETNLPIGSIIQYDWFDNLYKHIYKCFNRPDRYSQYSEIMIYLQTHEYKECYIDLVKLIYACLSRDLPRYIKKNRGAQLARLYDYNLDKSISAIREAFNE